MERKQIEDKDRDVVKKFRSAVVTKELKKKRKKKRINLIASLLAAGCAVVLALVLFLPREKSQIISTKEAGTQNLSIGQKDDSSLPATAGQQASKKSPSEQSDSKAKPPTDQPPPQAIAVATKTPQFEKKTKEIKLAALIKPDKKKPSKPSKKTQPGSVRITKILTCQSVKDRQHVSPQRQFSVKNDSRVYVWLDVESKNPPQTLKLIYYKNGGRYRTIPLSIKRTEMRTWSYISLNNLGDVGSWRVDAVTDGGETLSNIEFTVTP